MPKLTDAHFEARRKQILEATFRCLAQKGYSRMTMRDIAGEAGISVGTLYLYFKDKDEMVRALSEESRMETNADLEEDFTDKGPREILVSILGSLLQSLDDPRHQETLRVDVQLWAEALHHESLRDLCQAGLEERIGQLASLISEAQKADALPADTDPDALARILLAILSGLELQKVLDPDSSFEALGVSLLALLRVA
jgi:AcrR family transcriptional regulator